MKIIDEIESNIVLSYHIPYLRGEERGKERREERVI